MCSSSATRTPRQSRTRFRKNASSFSRVEAGICIRFGLRVFAAFVAGTASARAACAAEGTKAHAKTLASASVSAATAFANGDEKFVF